MVLDVSLHPYMTAAEIPGLHFEVGYVHGRTVQVVDIISLTPC